MSNRYCAIVAEIDKRLEDPVVGFFVQNLSHNLLLEENGKKMRVVGYLSPRLSIQEKKQHLARFLSELKAANPRCLPGRALVRYEKEFDWVEEFKKSFRPRQVAPGWWVAAPWHKGRHKNEIIIEPKMAFGTGEHATTQLCCQAALGLVRPGMKVLDFGTGSGILAILAAKLGVEGVLGIDNDSLAIENAEENAILNRVGQKVKLKLGSIEAVPDEKYDLIFANLILSQVKQFFPRFKKALKKDGLLVASGVLTYQLAELGRFLNEQGAGLVAFGRDCDWAALVVSP
ncbi:MAG TPA: 50S ribosomal protein L11 methyltransferase [Verrucomicrobiae bacterium]|nr:50S ribosomal protein L11 methyltransferase [Verrucomicrobiae bacterium]